MLHHLIAWIRYSIWKRRQKKWLANNPPSTARERRAAERAAEKAAVHDRVKASWKRDDYASWTQIFRNEGDLDERRAAMPYRKSKESLVIKQLLDVKYKQNSRVDASKKCAELAPFLKYVYNNSGWQADLIVPIPSAPSRLEQRGYNQAYLLAYPLSKLIGIPIKQVISRARDTASQIHTSSAAERLNNISGAFALSSEVFSVVEGKRVLLVDDIATSGYTMRECAALLKAAGAVQVWGLTLASGLAWDDRTGGKVDTKIPSRMS